MKFRNKIYPAFLFPFSIFIYLFWPIYLLFEFLEYLPILFTVATNSYYIYIKLVCYFILYIIVLILFVYIYVFIYFMK